MDDRHGTIEAEGAGWKIRFERRLAHPPAKVWDAITAPGQMSRWFDRTEFTTLEVGAPIRFIHEAAGMQSHGRITALEPGRLIEWEWTGPFGPASLSRWEIHPDGAGSRLVMTQSGLDRGVLARTMAGWHACLARLQAMLGDGDDQGGAGAWPALFDHYQAMLGQIATGAAVTREGDRTEGRFDRTLKAPPDAVWAALTRPERMAQWLAPASAPPEPGGHLVLTFGGSQPVKTRVVGYEEGRRLELEFEGGSGVRFEVTGLGGVSQLTVTTHEFLPPAEMAGRLAGWHFHLDGLAKVLAGQPFDPVNDRGWEPLEALYAQALS